MTDFQRNLAVIIGINQYDNGIVPLAYDSAYFLIYQLLDISCSFIDTIYTETYY
jgi:hypothetical protein